MANTYKVLGQVAPVAATETTLYTAASAAVVSTINICNRSASGGTFRVCIRPAGIALADKHYLAYDVPVPGADSIALTLGVTMTATDVLSVYSSSGLLSFAAFGSEVS